MKNWHHSVWNKEMQWWKSKISMLNSSKIIHNHWPIARKVFIPSRIAFFDYFCCSSAAKVMLLIDPTNQTAAIEFLTKLDPNFVDQNVKVRLSFSLKSLVRMIDRLVMFDHLRRHAIRWLWFCWLIHSWEISINLCANLANSKYISIKSDYNIRSIPIRCRCILW